MSEEIIAAKARSFFESLLMGDLERAASQLCEGAVKGLAEGLYAALQHRREPPSAEDYVKSNPSLPRAVAEHFAKDAERIELEQRDWWKSEFPGIETEEHLLSASASELSVRLVSALRPLYCGADWALDCKVLGAVLDGPDDGCVVFRCDGGRHRSDDGYVRELRDRARLLAMHRHNGTWCISDVHALRLGGGAWFLVEDPEHNHDRGLTSG